MSEEMSTFSIRIKREFIFSKEIEAENLEDAVEEAKLIKDMGAAVNIEYEIYKVGEWE